tara:strand:+ start:10698 stop:11729 length:1032 start_codon:yes stop_codon:yes gene_type:complete
MKVGMYYSNSDVRLEKMAIPGIGKNDVRIKVMASGICGTDLVEWHRKKQAPFIQGHEISGEIVKVGKNVKGYELGDRVFATHHVPCGECKPCEGYNPTLCNEFQTRSNFTPGGFSEYVRVSGRSVRTGMIKLPDNMSYEQGSFIEPLGTVLEATKVRPSDTVLVLGSGVLGMLNIKYAKMLGVKKIIATDIRESRLGFAEQFGADYMFKADEYTPDKLRKVNNGELADLVLLCAGAKQATEQALKSSGLGGRVIFFATPKKGEKVGIDFSKLWRTGFEWKPTYGASPKACRDSFELIRRGKIKVKDMITHRFLLEDISKGFEIASTGEDNGAKVIIKPHGIDR